MIYSFVLAVALVVEKTVPPSTEAEVSVYGITMFKPIPVPECGVFEDVVKYRKRNRAFGASIYPYARPSVGACYWRSDRLKAGTTAPLTFENVDIQFAPNVAPAMAYSVRALVMDNKVQAVQWGTRGLAQQAGVLASPTEKFGRPTKSDVVSKQNGFGARYDSIVASWLLPPGVTVDFQGSLTRVDQGSVVIMSEAARARVTDEMKKGDTSTPM